MKNEGGRAMVDYEMIERTPEFQELKRKKYRFIFPIPIVFVLYYLLFIYMSAYAKDFMSSFAVGNITYGYLFGVSYYVAVWILAGLYVWKAREYDRLVQDIIDKYASETLTKEGDV